MNLALGFELVLEKWANIVFEKMLKLLPYYARCFVYRWHSRIFRKKSRRDLCWNRESEFDNGAEIKKNHSPTPWTQSMK